MLKDRINGEDQLCGRVGGGAAAICQLVSIIYKVDKNAMNRRRRRRPTGTEAVEPPTEEECEKGAEVRMKRFLNINEELHV